MAKRSIALRLKNHNNPNLKSFAQTIRNGFVANAVIYPAPPVTVATQQNDIDDYSKALKRWGIRGNHGSTVAKAEVERMREVISQNLRTLSAYCMAVTVDDVESWYKVGFIAKRMGSRIETLPQVQNLRQIMAKNIPLNHVRLRWSRPLSVDESTIITYKVMRTKEPFITEAVQVGVVSRRQFFVDYNVPSGGRWYYCVIPVIRGTDGVHSDLCMAVSFENILSTDQ